MLHIAESGDESVINLISIDVGPFDAWLTLNMKLISMLYIIIYNFIITNKYFHY